MQPNIKAYCIWNNASGCKVSNSYTFLNLISIFNSYNNQTKRFRKTKMRHSSGTFHEFHMHQWLRTELRRQCICTFFDDFNIQCNRQRLSVKAVIGFNRSSNYVSQYIHQESSPPLVSQLISFVSDQLPGIGFDWSASNADIYTVHVCTGNTVSKKKLSDAMYIVG